MAAARRVVVLGVGNPGRADDAAGLACARALRKAFIGRPSSGLKIMMGYDAPENLTGKIRRFRPDLVLILDAGLGGRRPGTTFFVPPGRIVDETATTHQISLALLVAYLERSIGSRAVVLAIQPKTTAPGPSLSAPVRRAVEAIVESFVRLRFGFSAPVKGRAFGSPLDLGFRPRASPAAFRAPGKPGASAAVKSSSASGHKGS
jgi:hydrogenase maturation protease